MSELNAAVKAANLDPATLVPMRLPTGLEGVFEIVVPGNEALGAWDALRQALDPIGYRPLIRGDASEAAWELPHGSVDQILLRAAGTDFEDWVAGRYEALSEDDALPELGEWPDDVEPNASFMLPYDVLDGEPHERVGMVLIPAQPAPNVLAAIAWGGWNSCPLPEVHISAARIWAERHGAELVGASSDILEFVVGEPPQTQEAAMALAKEQYAYCPDIVDQGVGTIAALAATLLDAPVWYFWWD